MYQENIYLEALLGRARSRAAKQPLPSIRTAKNGDDVTENELAMLDFAIKWAPFGGGDEHILPEFGVHSRVFYQRLQVLLAHYPAVNDSVRHRLAQSCTLKLQASHSPAVACQSDGTTSLPRAWDHPKVSSSIDLAF